MPRRFSLNPPLEPGHSSPWVLRVERLSLPFAAPDHPGWAQFEARVARQFSDEKMIHERIKDLPEESRQFVMKWLIERLANETDDDKAKKEQEAIERYLSSYTGLADWIVEGLCLADPSKDRGQVERMVGDWPPHLVTDPTPE